MSSFIGFSFFHLEKLEESVEVVLEAKANFLLLPFFPPLPRPSAPPGARKQYRVLRDRLVDDQHLLDGRVQQGRGPRGHAQRQRVLPGESDGTGRRSAPTTVSPLPQPTTTIASP